MSNLKIQLQVTNILETRAYVISDEKSSGNKELVRLGGPFADGNLKKEEKKKCKTTKGLVMLLAFYVFYTHHFSLEIYQFNIPVLHIPVKSGLFTISSPLLCL